MNNRVVYMMPGSNAECRRDNDALIIHMLDTGSSKIFTGDKNDKTAGWPIGRQVWQSLVVTDPNFIQAKPVAGLQTGDNTMIIFGGETKQSFIFDQREVNSANK